MQGVPGPMTDGTKTHIPVEGDAAEAAAEAKPAKAGAGKPEPATPVKDAAESMTAAKPDPVAKGKKGKAPASKRRRRLGRSDRAAEEKKALVAERDALTDKNLRLQADFDNFRKRVLREKDELYRRANEDIILDLLPVLDHFELAMGSAESHDVPPAFVEGFKLVSEQLISALKKVGVERVEDENGAFDTRFHEAVSHLPSGDVPADHIMARVRKGYMLGDRLLRPAQVVVSSGPAPDQTGGE